MSSESPTEQIEIVEPASLGALEQMERASIDIQIATAKKYPRSLAVVKQKMLSFATLDEETAAGCFYTLPARRGGDGKALQGPSVRLAEIALATYGHLRAGARVIGDDGKVLTAQGVVHDLENNVCIAIEVKRRVTTKQGQRFSDDMIVTTGNAACSIALRNATFRVIPLALVKPVYEAAKRLAIGDAKSLSQRRAVAVEYFVKMGVPKDRVFGALGVGGIEDVTLEHLETLQGYRTAIADKEATIDEVFPLVVKAAKAPAKEDDVPFDFGAKKETPPAATVDDVKQLAAVVEEPKKPAPTPAPEPKQADKPAPTQPATTQPELLSSDETPVEKLTRLAAKSGIDWEAVETWAKARNLNANKDGDAGKIINAWASVSSHIAKGGKN